MEAHAYMRDLRWLIQNRGRKHAPDVFNDIVNRNMADGQNELQARKNALEAMDSALVRRV
jgi:hypothetical protein